MAVRITDSPGAPAEPAGAPRIAARAPETVRLDKAGYFVIIPQHVQQVILVEHYDYDNRLLRVFEGKDARALYHTIVAGGWVSELSHAAYLGKELTRAQAALESGLPYVQDGA